MNNENALAVVQETAGMVLAAQAKATVEARYIMALKAPRDMSKARENILKECEIVGFAESATYSRPQGKKKDQNGNYVENIVSGPSIRLAEAIIRSMKNILIDIITVFDSNEKRIVRVVVTDLESNSTYNHDVTIQKSVERKSKRPDDVVLGTRTNSYGDKVYIIEASDDEITNKQNALVSKALRNEALRLVPSYIIDESLEKCAETLRNNDQKNIDAAREKIFRAFDKLGISRESISVVFPEIGIKEIEKLRGYGQAIKEGSMSWRDVEDNYTKAQTPIEKMASKSAEANEGEPQKKVVTSHKKSNLDD